MTKHNDTEKYIEAVLPVAWMCVTLMLSGQKGESSSGMSFGIPQIIRDTFSLPMKVMDVNHILRMSAHIFIFGTEGILLMNAMKRLKSRTLFSMCTCTVLSVIDEAHKIFVPGRHCHSNEIILDIVSALVTIVMSEMILRILEQKNGSYNSYKRISI